jgi:hypothetical protein
MPCVVLSAKLHSTSKVQWLINFSFLGVKGHLAGNDAGPEAVGLSNVGPMWISWASHVPLDADEEADAREAAFLAKLPPPTIKLGRFAR